MICECLLHIIIPDITIIRFKGHFEILLNDYNYPSIHINKYYLSLLKTERDPELHRYLNEKLKQAENVQDFIHKRGSTLMRLAQYIADSQQDFFLYGPDELRPCRMKDAAEQMEVHESTVSRAVRDKYLQCTWGIFPLSFFFSGAVEARTRRRKDESSVQEADEPAEINADTKYGSPGADDVYIEVSVTKVKSEIRRLIEHEDKKKPYSDQKLTNLLEEMGYDISRRTVAKYREQMGLGNGRERKQY